MKYCGDRQCRGSKQFFQNDDNWCSVCRQELVPAIQCLCGKEEWNPFCVNDQHCPSCGNKLTAEYFGRCMHNQLHGMVREISTKLEHLN